MSKRRQIIIIIIIIMMMMMMMMIIHILIETVLFRRTHLNYHSIFEKKKEREFFVLTRTKLP